MNNLESQIEARGLRQEPGPVSPKRMVSYQIERRMAQLGISRLEMAQKMNTSRAALNRLLDPENPSVTLQTMQSAAKALGLNIVISFEEMDS